MSKVYNSHGRPGAPPTLTRGQLRATFEKSLADVRRMNPDLNYGLGVCKVINIDYEAMLVTLRTLQGTSKNFDRVPVPLTFPGAGRRHFFGAMPEIGDYCVVGWQPQESGEKGGGTKTPVILSWVVPGVWPGRDWLTTSEIETDEYDTTPGERTALAGAYDRIRHKLRHMGPGNIVASSSQGSDMVLDEGVSFANRRGNEIRLRDQDQAFLVRSLQQFHAMAGARIYAGMVQRDATFLPAMMVSDGKIWDGNYQSGANIPVNDTELPTDLTFPASFLTPAKMLQKAPQAEGGVGRSILQEDEYLDPYKFLRNGGYINADGFVSDGKHSSDANYGGKNLFRVTSQEATNATLAPDAQTLTEYRIEVTHTSDGRLPVTEQTDGFDSDRLPNQDPEQETGGLPPNQPFIEFVLGSVIGNDPFTPAGRLKYGLPLVAQVFDGNTPNPRLEPAVLAAAGSNETPTPLRDQAATLFRLTPPVGEGKDPGTFISFNKQGQMRAMIGGDHTQNSVEAWLTGGLKLGVGGRFQFLNNGHIELGTKSKHSLHLSADEGGVRIYGGGPVKTHEALVEPSLGTGRGPQDIPAVDIEARTNIRLKAERQILVKGGEVVVNAATTQIMGHESVEIAGGRRTAISTDNFQLSVAAKATESYMGPKYASPSNFPLHERIYAPTVPGVAERVKYALGADREEIFEAGNHSTHVKIGDMAYKLDAGTWKVEAATASLEMGADGIAGKATVGDISLNAEAGAASMSGLTSVTVEARGGSATLRGSTGVHLGGPISGPDMGGIICSGSLEPFTGLPFSTWGMGAANHTVGT